MNNIIYNNAYGILGLLPNASQKELSRRMKEIEKFISIEELPSYPYDYNVFDKERATQSVHNAFLSISNVNSQILHHFFRVYANTDKQMEELNNIESEFTYQNITDIYQSKTQKNFIFEKNMALVLTLLLMSEGAENDENAVNLCINIWHSIIRNEKYIKDFKKIFLLDDELGIDESIFDHIEEQLISELTKVFSDIAQKYSDNNILSVFIDKFELNNNVFNIDAVEEIYSNIQKNIEIMDAMDISADGVFDDQEKAQLKNCLSAFQENFNELIDLGLYDNEKTVILRDLVATKIRIQIIDLFNNLEEDVTALNLMKFAIYIVGTEGLKDKLTNEIQVISNTTSLKKYFEELTQILNRWESVYDKYFHDIDEYLVAIDQFVLKIVNDSALKLTDKAEILDDVAYRLRKVALNYNNDKKDYNKSLRVIKKACEIAFTKEAQRLCSRDLETISKNKDTQIYNFFAPAGIIGLFGYLIYKVTEFGIRLIRWIIVSLYNKLKDNDFEEK